VEFTVSIKTQKSGEAHFNVKKWSEGKQLLIAFHGFSQDRSYYKLLSQALDGNYCVCAVDMPFHGKTEWPAGDPCRPQDVAALCLAICGQLNYEMFSLAGFSMGAKYAISMAANCPPDEMKELFLFSPEGVRANPALEFFSRNPLGKVLMAFSVHFPYWVTIPVKTLSALGLLKKKMADFIMANVKNKAIRNQLRYTWLAMAGLYKAGTHLIERSDYPYEIYMYTGSRDPLLKPRAVHRFLEAIPEIQHRQLDRGHFLVDRDLGKMILEQQARHESIG
jgi:pimeloyl-ACP methyl ester carboxylesterase